MHEYASRNKLGLEGPCQATMSRFVKDAGWNNQGRDQLDHVEI